MLRERGKRRGLGSRPDGHRTAERAPSLSPNCPRFSRAIAMLIPRHPRAPLTLTSAHSRVHRLHPGPASLRPHVLSPPRSLPPHPCSIPVPPRPHGPLPLLPHRPNSGSIRVLFARDSPTMACSLEANMKGNSGMSKRKMGRLGRGERWMNSGTVRRRIRAKTGGGRASVGGRNGRVGPVRTAMRVGSCRTICGTMFGNVRRIFGFSRL